MKKIAEKALEKCVGLKKEEQTLIITDEHGEKVGKALYKASKEKTNETYLLKVRKQEKGELEVPELAEHLMKKPPDVILIPTKNSYTHTKAREKATEKGARVVTLPGITEEMFKRTTDIDYGKLREEGKKLQEKMEKAEKAKIKTGSGTNLNLDLSNQTIPDLGQMKEKGEYGNLPTGELFTAPENSNGKMVIDSMQELAEPKTEVYIQENEAREIEGDPEFKKKIMKKEHRKNIAELGIGLNPKATVTGNILEDEKVRGTCHIAFGKNKDFGGKIDSDIHWDAILFQPTIHFDNEKIMETGELQI